MKKQHLTGIVLVTLCIFAIALWWLQRTRGRLRDPQDNAPQTANQPANSIPEPPVDSGLRCDAGNSVAKANQCGEAKNPGAGKAGTPNNPPALPQTALPERRTYKSFKFIDIPVEPARTLMQSARGKDERFFAVRATPPTELRLTGPLRMMGGKLPEGPTRLVHGTVYELRGAKRMPLGGVMVHDLGAHRTFTGPDGRFEFLARFEDRLDAPELGYCVDLATKAEGFRPWLGSEEGGGSTYYREDLETPEGAEIYMEALANQSVSVRVTNPGLVQGDLEIHFEYCVRYGGISGDERTFISTVADAAGCAVFSLFPRRFSRPAAVGKGAQSSPGSTRVVKETETEIEFELTLEPRDNYLASGAVTDIRTGKYLPAVRIAGAGWGEVAYSDARGKFAIWLSRDGVNNEGKRISQRYIQFDALGYAGFSRDADPGAEIGGDTGLASVGPGGKEAGPWLVQMRPWVAARGRVIANGYVFSAEDTLTIPSDSEFDVFGPPLLVAVDTRGEFLCERIPWGITGVRFNSSGPLRPRGQPTIDPTGWEKPEPFELVVGFPK